MWVLWQIWTQVVDCHERKANFKNKKNGQGKTKPDQNKKDIWKQGDSKGKRKFSIPKINVSTVINMDTLQKVAPTRKIEQT